MSETDYKLLSEDVTRSEDEKTAERVSIDLLNSLEERVVKLQEEIRRERLCLSNIIMKRLWRETVVGK